MTDRQKEILDYINLRSSVSYYTIIQEFRKRGTFKDKSSMGIIRDLNALQKAGYVQVDGHTYHFVKD